MRKPRTPKVVRRAKEYRRWRKAVKSRDKLPEQMLFCVLDFQDKYGPWRETDFTEHKYRLQVAKAGRLMPGNVTFKVDRYPTGWRVRVLETRDMPDAGR